MIYNPSIYSYKIKKSDFAFKQIGYGRWRVTYISPLTGKMWSTITTDSTLIDAVLHEEYPKKKDLESLKWIVKNL
jgi:hypothetical protein